MDDNTSTETPGTVTDFYGALKRIEKALNKAKAKRAAALQKFDDEIAKLEAELTSIGEKIVGRGSK